MGVATKFFEIKPPEGMTEVKLDSKGNATVQYTVKNVCQRGIDGHAQLVSLPRQPNGVIERGWASIVPPVDRHFGIDEAQQFVVKIAVPANSPAGDYSFRFEVMDQAQTDRGDAAPAMGFHVAESAPPGPSRWPLIALVAVLVLMVGGVTVWLLTRGTAVPDLSGKTPAEAATILGGLKLALDQEKIEQEESTLENSGKVVKQDPLAGKKVNSGTLVRVTVGTQMTSMPVLLGHTFAEAQGITNRTGLGLVTSTSAPSPDYSAAGIVWRQTPDPGKTVKRGSPVAVTVTPSTVPVVRVVGMSFTEAVSALQRAGLTPGSSQGDTSQRVQSQYPPSGMVPVGTPVNLTFTCPPGLLCGMFNAGLVQRTYVDKTYSIQMLPQVAPKK